VTGGVGWPAPPAHRAEVWHPDSADFPESLRAIPRPPRALWTLGDRSVLDAPRVAIVGTRAMTAYGERVTRRLAAALARAGACVISGMARGIDATAHRAVLEVRGRTAAVLGTGADVPYPAGHRPLHAEIARQGLVLSEESPGVLATRGCFPRRNRLIAGLAKLVIVVEAPFRSGANNTVAHAAELPDCTIAVVPGPIDSPQSQGCNLLLQQGVHPITCANDALALVGLRQEPEEAPPLAPTQQKIWEALSAEGSASVDLIVARTALPLREALVALTSLELEGLVVCDAGGLFHQR
jgi:DNA processing protein